MVYLKRYGFKFYPLDGENTSYSFTRGAALLGGIILAFLFAGLDVPVVYYVVGFAVSIFLVSLVGEKWEAAGLVFILIAVISSLYFTVSFHLGGLGQHQGIGLLYIYLGVVFALAASDYYRAKGADLGRARLTCILFFLTILAVLGFGPFEAQLASLRKFDSCWIETKSHWRSGFHVTHRSWAGHNDVGITQGRHYARFHHEPIATLYDIGDSKFVYGEISGIKQKRVMGFNILGLEVFQGREKYLQWLGPVDADCYSDLRQYLGFPNPV